MISSFMPTSLGEELPTMKGKDGKILSPLAILLLQVTLSFSGGDYHDAHPGQTILMRRTGIKTRDSLRKFFGDLEHNQVLIVTTKTEKTPNGKILSKNSYCFTFGKWIDKDRARGIAGRLSDTKKSSVPRPSEEIIAGFDFETLPHSLRQWREHLEPMGRFQNTWYFKAKTAVSASFVESEFQKHKIAIRVTSAA